MTDQEKIIYDILCSDEQPPEGQHWEGFVASKIVAALAQPEQAPTNNGRYLTGYKAQPEQEPVAYLYKNIEDYEKHVGFECNDAFIVGWNMARTTERMLSNYFYTAPPHREWVGLNPKEISEITMYCQNENPAFFRSEEHTSEL